MPYEYYINAPRTDKPYIQGVPPDKIDCLVPLEKGNILNLPFTVYSKNEKTTKTIGRKCTIENIEFIPVKTKVVAYWFVFFGRTIEAYIPMVQISVDMSESEDLHSTQESPLVQKAKEPEEWVP